MNFIEKIKAAFQGLGAGIQQRKSGQSTPQPLLAEVLQHANEGARVSLVKSRMVQRPIYEWTYGYAIVAILGYIAAQVVILSVRDKMLPTSAPPAQPAPLSIPMAKPRSQYNIIATRDIFNSDGIIPPPLSQPNAKDIKNLDGPATESTLPLVLVGTIVHKNPAKSIATIEIKAGGSKIIPFVVNDEIENFGILLRVDRKRAILRNNQTGGNEYIEIRDKSAINFGIRNDKNTTPVASGPPQLDFSLPRTDVNNYIKNLPELLQQARAEPNMVNGKLDGYLMKDIMPGSIYEKLGLKVGDVIKSVNGEVLDSPTKGMEMYQALRNSNKISIEVDRNGTKETLTYNIN